MEKNLSVGFFFIHFVSLSLHKYICFRSPRGLSHSPWAVKKINPLCDDHYRNVYQKRLTDEAKILKDLNHPNIIGKSTCTCGSMWWSNVLCSYWFC